MLALLLGLAAPSANSNNQHLNTYISFADKLKNWWDFSGKKKYIYIYKMTIIFHSPFRSPA